MAENDPTIKQQELYISDLITLHLFQYAQLLFEIVYETESL